MSGRTSRAGVGQFRVRTRGGRGTPRQRGGWGNSGFNRFSVLSSQNGDQGGDDVFPSTQNMDTADGFTVVKRKQKRQRVSTGGTSVTENEFASMSLSDKLSTMYSKIASMEAKVDRVSKLSKQVQAVDASIETHADRLRVLEYKSIDADARSRRKNILFRGIGEYFRENCFEQVQTFIMDQLHIREEMFMDRAHRIGLKSSKGPRPIIVTFRDENDVDLLMREVYRLKGSNYGVSRDYPIEIVQARKALWPHYKSARRNRANRVSIKFPARLVVNGTTTHDCFPDWGALMRAGRVKVTCTSMRGRNDTASGPSMAPGPTEEDYNRSTDYDDSDDSDESDDSDVQSEGASNSTDPGGEDVTPVAHQNLTCQMNDGNRKGASGHANDVGRSDVVRRTDVSHADVSHADVSHADVSHADVSHTDVSHADVVSHADGFSGTNVVRPANGETEAATAVDSSSRISIPNAESVNSPQRATN